MILACALLVLGFILLILGANLLVKGASSFAKRFNVPEIVIGLTIVAFGTSTPELVVNIFSSLHGSSELVFGNVIGSNNFNLLIILGFSALLYPLDVRKSTVWREIPFALLITGLVMLLANDQWFNSGAQNVLDRWDGAILLLIFAIFLTYTHHLGRTAELSAGRVKTYSLLWTVCFVLGGFAGLILGGNMVVKNAIALARFFQISEKIIGLTIVAAGTSLPELATSVVAALKKHPDIAVGNIVGSNIFNLLLILGVTSMILPPAYHVSFNPDLYLMIFSTFLLFLLMFVSTRHRLDRWQGALFLALYAVYAIFFLK
jgi:cation:H+ antiporter